MHGLLLHFSQSFKIEILEKTLHYHFVNKLYEGIFYQDGNNQCKMPGIQTGYSNSAGTEKAITALQTPLDAQCLELSIPVKNVKEIRSAKLIKV